MTDKETLHHYCKSPDAMTNKTIQITDALYDYLLSVSLREADMLRRLRAETARLPMANMQIAPEQGQFMALLVELLGVRNALEIGVFTGYSALCVALALPDDGRLVACDLSEEWTRIAERYWTEAGVRNKIELTLAPATDTLDALLAGGAAGSFDFAFIDADKTSYDAYFERALRLLRSGGLIVVDNVLWSGKVADTREPDADTAALRAFNTKLHHDPRVSLSMIPVADGLTLARKR
jgi:predicted O-methyltransferase YrrM